MQTLILGVEILGLSILISLVGLYVVRRAVGVEKLQSHHEVAGFIIGIVGTIYAVLLAFLVVVQWNKYTDASNMVTTEANLLGDISRMAEGLPSDQRQQILTELRDYAQLVADDEWPALANGNSSDKTTDTLNKLWKSYVIDQKPQTNVDTALYTESLRRLNDLSDTRRLRINASQDTVPAMMWILLIGGGITTVAFTYFFGVSDMRAQSLMVTALTGEIAFILLLLVVLDNPFKGDIAVSSGPIREQAAHIGGRINKGGF
jgi:hypothetical protein